MKEERCDLCIVGAGYAALNGLNAAAKYLKPGARVVVIDKNDAWGGQWLHQYDFVRLHQPYRMFTAGDQPWKLQRDAGHLATRREVLDHLGSVPGVSAGHLELVPLFGHTYRSHRVRDGRVEVDAEANDGGRVTVRADRLLKGTGVDIEALKAFPVTSTRVRSVAVSDPVLTSPELLQSAAPVYVIGSGKTAMDTVRHVATQSPGRAVHVITGSGMWFFTRDTLYPRGLARYAIGELTGDIFRRMALEFDGTNETAVMESLHRRGHALHVFGEAGNCRYGLLSHGERDEIRRVATVHRGHLVDVEGLRMTLRDASGLREVDVVDGAWLINCTTHFRELPHQPVLQDGGLTCAPQGALGFSGTTAYFLTHLWLLDQLAPVADALYRVRVDVEPKLRFAPEVALMVMANLALVSPLLPLAVPSKFRGDFNKWYPLGRQLAMLVRLRAARSALLSKAERLLKGRFSDPV